jgi:ribosomal protein L11 methyltransferase
VKYPALDVHSRTPDLVAAIVDDFSPAAIEERPASVRVFFPTPETRASALDALARHGHPATSIDVDDEDWAARSQASLGPITAGRLTIAPPWAAGGPAQSVIVIQPSTGFGTGHHATTRLCLETLQDIDLNGRTMLDVGTGSGVLAIAAVRLGARRAIGIDDDPDAVRAARENLALNPGAGAVAFDVVDLTAGDLRTADVLTANLTGAVLLREAGRLAAAVAPGGFLIASGILSDEGPSVRSRFGALTLVREREEEGWICLLMTKS